jgi:U2 small nuclear ribonucleoprotein B''
VFSQFGNILEIHATKTLKLRGQAWIVFDDLSGATKALREMQGFNFYGKPMKVSYAKVKSDVISKTDGSFKPRPKRKPDAKAPAKVVPKKKTKKGQDEDSSESKTSNSSTTTTSSSSSLFLGGDTPNKILFIENLPSQTNEMMLSMLFQQYTGYREARLVNGKPGIAFVEFEQADQATRARDHLQNFKITPTNQMKISYAKQ